MGDLGEAIRKAQQAVEVTPQDHPDLVGRLSNQGRCSCLQSTFSRPRKIIQQVLSETLLAHLFCLMVVENYHPTDDEGAAWSRSKEGSRHQQRLEHFTWARFPTAMATGSLVVVLYQTPD
jgi:hypothetical protein